MSRLTCMTVFDVIVLTAAALAVIAVIGVMVLVNGETHRANGLTHVRRH